MLVVPWLHDAGAAESASDKILRISGDVPGAFSYDVFARLYPLNVEQLARLAKLGQVKLIVDNTLVYILTGDSIADPKALCVSVPSGR